MTEAAPLVVISVLNWHGAARTIACLDALRQLDYPNYRVVIVDNASRDDSAARIAAAHPGLPLIRAPENLGYAGGNALALDHARALGANLFWILNNDARPEPGALTALVDAWRQFGPAVYGSATVYERDGVRYNGVRTWPLRPDLTPDYSRPFFHQPHDVCFPTGAPLPVANLSGSSLMIPLAVIDQFGYLETEFFLYGEEPDYCKRLRRAGLPAVIVPRSVVLHNPAGSHKNESATKPVIIYYQVRSRLDEMRRNDPRPAYLRRLALELFYVPAWMIRALWKGPGSARAGLFAARAVRDHLRRRRGRTYDPADFLPAASSDS